MIEEYSLIFSRNCNLKCTYCVQYHEELDMEKQVIESFFYKVMKKKDFKEEIVIYWWEPTLNLKWFRYLQEILNLLNPKLINENRKILIRIDTNWCFSKEIIDIFCYINKLDSIILSIDVSIDWVKLTNDKYRLTKKWDSYFYILESNILLMKEKWLKIRGAVVIPYINYSFRENIIYLLDYLKLDELIFMPQMMMNNFSFLKRNQINLNDFKKFMTSYNINLKWFAKFIYENPAYMKKIANFNLNTYYDILDVPFWPCLDYDWKIYKTRVFFHGYKWKLFWQTKNNILINSLDEIEKDFYISNYKTEVNLLTKEFTWEFYNINFIIIKNFNKLVYKIKQSSNYIY